MTEWSNLALSLSMTLSQPGLPPEVARHLVEAMREVAAPRDETDPLQLRRDVSRIASLLEDLYGDRAVAQAKRVSQSFGEPAFARLVILFLERSERERGRGQVEAGSQDANSAAG